MKSKIFDGYEFAEKKLLNQKLQNLSSFHLVSIVHKEDDIGQIYTNLKQEKAKEIGVSFDKIEISFSKGLSQAKKAVLDASNDPETNGLLIQKPSKSIWSTHYKGNLPFYDWWESLTDQINPKKDVDCLTRTNLNAVYENKSDFLPATAQAILDILRFALSKDDLDNDWGNLTISFVGKSELAGKPLSEKLSQWGAKTYLLGSKDNLMDFLPRSDVIVSATGKEKLITVDMVKNEAIVIDVGEPNPDVDIENVKKITSFITPVPGGVGPVTILCLFKNLALICSNS